MKIYEIGTGYAPIPAQISAATEIIVEELTKAFLKQNISVEIIDIAADNRKDNQLPIREVSVPKVFNSTDVQLGIMHKLKRVVYSVLLTLELRKILKKTDEMVILHFHNQYNMFFFLKLTPKRLRSKALTAYTNHSGIWRLNWNEIKHTISKRYFQEAECMKQADVVFLLNEETKRNVMKHLMVPAARLVLLNNGVNTDVYCPLSLEEREQAKECFGLKGKKVILQVGSVNENKGQLRTLERIEPLLEENPDVVYAYVGGIVDQEYHQKIQQWAADCGLEKQVKYIGMLSPGENLNALYNSAVATVLASKFEAFGLVVIESFSAGVPVLVEQDSLVSLGGGSVQYTQETLSQTIELLIAGDTEAYKRLCEEARENAVNNYSWDVISADYMAAFHNRVMKNV